MKQLKDIKEIVNPCNLLILLVVTDFSCIKDNKVLY
jgi:hypothetical protein